MGPEESRVYDPERQFTSCACTTDNQKDNRIQTRREVPNSAHSPKLRTADSTKFIGHTGNSGRVQIF